MHKSQAFGIGFSRINKEKLSDYLYKVTSQDKLVLNFGYSEMIVRANRNPEYKKVLNLSHILAIDGTGLLWAHWFLNKYLRVNQLKRRNPIKACGHVILSGFYRILSKYNFSKDTGIELILGRDYVYNLLDIAQHNHWSVNILGTSPQTIQKLQSQYPNITFKAWYKDRDSQLMTDNVWAYLDSNSNSKRNLIAKHQALNLNNLTMAFPDLREAQDFISKNPCQLIINCLGGASGKQEIFAEYLKQDSRISFGIIANVGAALDHFDQINGQSKPNSRMQKLGLEWLFRLVFHSRRRLRVLDAIWSLTILTIQEYIKN